MRGLSVTKSRNLISLVNEFATEENPLDVVLMLLSAADC
jgi:hypothetical protein